MPAAKAPHDHTTSEATSPRADTKLEVVALPVSNLDRAKEFYLGLGWRLDADLRSGSARLIQLTPPGSACSVQFGTNVTSAAPGSARGAFLVVSDVQAARDELVARGVTVSEVFHYSSPPGPFGDKVDGLAPDRRSYASFATFSDRDGNGWVLQEITTRLPGRVDAATTSFASASDLASALRRASEAHGRYEQRTGGQRDENWPDWYAKYLVAEQRGDELPS